nr:MAG TPA: hypothetical protein [Caudoviricetes sp.]
MVILSLISSHCRRSRRSSAMRLWRQRMRGRPNWPQ